MEAEAKKPLPAEKLGVGLIQFAFQAGKVDANLKEADRLVGEAVQKGAELIVLPELWSIGYGLDDPASFAETQTDGKTVKFMVEKAKEHKVYVCGGYPELDNGVAYNSAMLINPEGQIILNHRKVLLYTALDEDKIWAAGDRYSYVDTPLGRLAILICYDADFPEAWRVLAANHGVDMIIHPTAYESPCEEWGWWTKLYEANAIRNSVWVISANMVGQTATGSNFFGGSRVIDPTGNTLASANYVKLGEKAESELLVMNLDFAKGLEEGKANTENLITDRKIEVFHRSDDLLNSRGVEGNSELKPLASKPAPAEKLTIASIQFPYIPQTMEENIKAADALIDEAAAKGAELIILPELWSTISTVEPVPVSQTDGKMIKFLQEKAKQHKVYICGGYMEKNEGHLPYDSAVFINPEGELVFNYRKVELYGPLDEDKVFGSADRYNVIETPFGRIAILIGYDADFPEPWRIVAATKGADLIIHPTTYESPCEELGWWTKLYEAGAIENAVWLVSANVAGESLSGTSYFGGSRIIDPMGNTVASASYFKAGNKTYGEVLVKTIDFAKGLQEGKKHNGSLVSDRRLDVFRENGL